MESNNSFFCNGKNPSASTRSLWKLPLRRDDHTGLPAALSPPAARFEGNAVHLSPSTLCDYYSIRLPAKKQASQFERCLNRNFIYLWISSKNTLNLQVASLFPAYLGRQVCKFSAAAWFMLKGQKATFSCTIIQFGPKQTRYAALNRKNCAVCTKGFAATNFVFD